MASPISTNSDVFHSRQRKFSLTIYSIISLDYVTIDFNLKRVTVIVVSILYRGEWNIIASPTGSTSDKNMDIDSTLVVIMPLTTLGTRTSAGVALTSKSDVIFFPSFIVKFKKIWNTFSIPIWLYSRWPTRSSETSRHLDCSGPFRPFGPTTRGQTVVTWLSATHCPKTDASFLSRHMPVALGSINPSPREYWQLSENGEL